MDSFNDVLDAAKAYCREHTADATYQYYISGLKAVSFENSNCITLEVRNDFICKIVSDRYTGLLKDAFKAVLGFDVEVKFTVPQPEPEAAKEKRPMDEASLPSGRYDFTFENFIRGPSNQFAFAAAQAVAANPSGAYNPLFIYGPSGLGKTHLLNAIQIEIHKIIRTTILSMWTAKSLPTRSSPRSKWQRPNSSARNTAKPMCC